MTITPNSKAGDILKDTERINEQIKKLEEIRKNLQKGM